MSEQPSSPLEWAAWARTVVSELRLPSHEAHVLCYLASRADRRGSCRPGIALIAAETTKAVSTVKRILTSLAKRGLIVSRQRGQSSAVRELVADAARWVGGQLSLFDSPATPPAAREQGSKRASPGPVVRAAAAGPERAPSVERERASSLTGEPQQSHQRAPEEPEKAQGTAERNRAAAPAAPGTISTSLEPVLEQLAEVSDRVMVDPAAVDCALRSFPGLDHAQAASVVVIWVLDGLRKPAGTLLAAALRRQQADRDRCETRARRGTSRRSRGESPVANTGDMSRFASTWGAAS